MEYYLTWGIGYGTKLLAEKNALRDALLTNLEISKFESLELPSGKFHSKGQLEKVKGKLKGIILRKCVKGDAAVALAIGVREGKIFIGKGKAGSIAKAEKIAESELKGKFEHIERISAFAPARKGLHACAVVGLLAKC